MFELNTLLVKLVSQDLFCKQMVLDYYITINLPNTIRYNIVN